MAAGEKEVECVKRSKRMILFDPIKLPVGLKVEVRSMEEGFQGSWHSGTVISCLNQEREIRYDNLIDENYQDNLLDSVKIFGEDGIKGSNHRGIIRPVCSEVVKVDKSRSSYGLCVDAYYQQAWWEGVIFDYNFDSDERKIFFPDIGDELILPIDSLRITHDWDELTDRWSPRNTWTFLELLEKFEKDYVFPVSVKQIWYDLREKIRFAALGNWTSTQKVLWKELISEVIFDNLQIVVNHLYDRCLKQETDSGDDGFDVPEAQERREFYPEAVEEYSKVHPSEIFRRIEVNEINKIKARKHLEAMGWKISFKRKGAGRFLQYENPRGKLFSSLRTACIGYLDDDSSIVNKWKQDSDGERVSKRRKTNSSLHHTNQTIKKETGRSSGLSGYRLRSTKRVPEVTRSSNCKRGTVLSWLIDNNALQPGANVSYLRKKDKVALAQGIVTQDGIQCNCCSNVFTVSTFEAHAGSTARRPSANIFLKDGRTLLDCQVEANRRKRKPVAAIKLPKGEQNLEENDDICSVCYYDGELILCDHCPSAFHRDCLGLRGIPDDEWFCPSCCCGICGQNKHKEGYGFISCKQCERNYHVNCISNPKVEDHWFCGQKCEQIYESLQNLLGKPIPVGEDKLTWTLVKSDHSSEFTASDLLTETRSKLNMALDIMHECFEPVKDIRSQTDLHELIIFSRSSGLKRLNCKGFYTILLERDDELITVASVRVFGGKVAEIPLVGTRSRYRRRGMCSIMMKQLEKELVKIGVERLVLPSIPSVLHTWTGSFGFEEMTPAARLDFLSYTFLDFPGTKKCQKILMKSSLDESSSLEEYCIKFIASQDRQELLRSKQVAKTGTNNEKVKMTNSGTRDLIFPRYSTTGKVNRPDHLNLGSISKNVKSRTEILDNDDRIKFYTRRRRRYHREIEKKLLLRDYSNV